MNLTLGESVLIYNFSSRFNLRRENRPIIYLSMGIGISPLKAMVETFLINSHQVPSLRSINVSSPTYNYKSFLPACKGLTSDFLHSKEAYYKVLKESYNENAIYYIIGSDEFIIENITYLKEKGQSFESIELDKKTDKKKAIWDSI
jgi:ferredoxin--NADP+ reductase